MDDSLQELKYVLQILALPVSGQVHLLKQDCTRVDDLAGAFNATHHAIRAEGDQLLTSPQADTLARLDNTLAQVREQPICSELSMRESPEWRQIRTMARESLVRFGWPLEVPPRTLPTGRGNERLLEISHN
jgi:hypothetical protein